RVLTDTRLTIWHSRPVGQVVKDELPTSPRWLSPAGLPAAAGLSPAGLPATARLPTAGLSSSGWLPAAASAASPEGQPRLLGGLPGVRLLLPHLRGLL
ncbi:hypothetical protein COCSUDRAFT_68057, partial [Coccomyxa subellipsoidea C-169]